MTGHIIITAEEVPEGTSLRVETTFTGIDPIIRHQTILACIRGLGIEPDEFCLMEMLAGGMFHRGMEVREERQLKTEPLPKTKPHVAE